MRKQNLWVVALITTLLIIVSAISAVASKKKVSEPPQPTEETAPAQQADASGTTASDEPVTVILQLNSDDAGVKTENAVSSPSSGAGPENAQPASLGFLKKLSSMAVGFIGTPYRWGGTTPSAFDCSGFTRYCYARLGIRLPRTAREQFKTGKVVTAGNWKAGDLIFFDMMKGYVSHVGMYLGGNRFIHASNPRTGVRIDTLDRKTYKRCYVGARRYYCT